MKKIINTLYRPIAWIVNDKKSRILFSLTYGQTTIESIELLKQVTAEFNDELARRKLANDNENKKILEYLPKIETIVKDPRFDEPIQVTLNTK